MSHLYHEMLEKRRLIVSEVITSELVEKLIQLIQSLALKGDENVELKINSIGGSTEATLRLHDVIKNSGLSFHGVVLGKCMSAAVILLQACDIRRALAHSTFLLHHPTGEYRKLVNPHKMTRADFLRSCAKDWDNTFRIGKVSEAVICSRLRNRRLYNKYYLSMEEKYFDADTALKMGLIDEIIEG